MKLISLLFSLISPLVVAALTSGCSSKSSSASPGVDLALCTAIDGVQLVASGADPTAKYRVSINDGQVAYDDCSTTPSDDTYLTFQGSSLAINTAFAYGSSIRSAYFSAAAGTYPLRTDLKIAVTKRVSCSSPEYVWIATEQIRLTWQQVSGAGANGCSQVGYLGSSFLN